MAQPTYSDYKTIIQFTANIQWKFTAPTSGIDFDNVYQDGTNLPDVFDSITTRVTDLRSMCDENGNLTYNGILLSDQYNMICRDGLVLPIKCWATQCIEDLDRFHQDLRKDAPPSTDMPPKLVATLGMLEKAIAEEAATKKALAKHKEELGFRKEQLVQFKDLVQWVKATQGRFDTVGVPTRSVPGMNNGFIELRSQEDVDSIVTFARRFL